MIYLEPVIGRVVYWSEIERASEKIKIKIEVEVKGMEMEIESVVMIISIIGIGFLIMIWPKSEVEIKFQKHLMENPVKATIIFILIIALGLFGVLPMLINALQQ